VVDFLYTCDAHLSDTGFATELVDPASPSASNKEAVSKEEIARIKAEWEAKEARKKEKTKGVATSKESGKNGDAKGEDEKRVEDGKNGAGAGSPSPSPSPSATGAAALTHKRYSLHRNFYAMRQDEHRRRRQTKQIQELAPRLPGAPHGSLVG
jgi:hypothetical protein